MQELDQNQSKSRSASGSEKAKPFLIDSVKDILTSKNSSGFRNSEMRWLALALTSLSCFGNYFSSDLPQSMMNSIRTQLDLDVYNYNKIFSVYSIPNVILPFVGGLIIDSLGVRLAYAIFAFILILGQAITTLGVAQESFNMMLFGQFIFSLGGDCQLVAKSAMVAKWFRGKELSFALGIGLCIARLGSSLDSFLSPKLAVWSNTPTTPFILGIFLCAFSFFCVIFINIIDKQADQYDNNTNQETTKEATSRPKFSDIKHFPCVFYLLILNCGCLYAGFYGFTNNLSDILITRFGFTQGGSTAAGNIIPIIFFCAVILTPIIGSLVDKYGKRALIMLFACIIYFFDNLFIAFYPDSPKGQPNYIAVLMLFGTGLFYASYAAVFWPCVALAVKQRLTGIAYGVMLSFQNVVLMIVPLYLGKLHDTTTRGGGYFWTQITLAGLVGLGALITSAIYIQDLRTTRKFNDPSSNVPDRSSSVLSAASDK